jgi:hypothetical protein
MIRSRIYLTTKVIDIVRVQTHEAIARSICKEVNCKTCTKGFPMTITLMLEYEVIWGILVGRLKLFRSLSRSEQVKLY